MIYQIPNWNEVFENERSRRLGRLTRVQIPNKHDSQGYLTLIRRPNGPLLYAAWVLIVEVASKCPKRGVLVRNNGTPHTAESLAIVTNTEKGLFEAALPELINVGWLSTDVSPIHPLPPAAPPISPPTAPQVPTTPPPPTHQPPPKERRGGEGEERKEGKAATGAAGSPPEKKLNLPELARNVYNAYRDGYRVKAPQCVELLVKRLKACETHDEVLVKYNKLLQLTSQYVHSPAGQSEFCSNSDTFFRSKIEEDDPASWNTNRDRKSCYGTPAPRPAAVGSSPAARQQVEDLLARAEERAAQAVPDPDGVDFDPGFSEDGPPPGFDRDDSGG